MKFGAPFLGAFATCDPIALRDYVQAVEGLGYSHLIAVMVFGRIAGRLCTGNPITNADSHSAAAYCGPRTDPEAGSDLRESGLPLQRARGSTGRVRPRRRAGGSQQPVDQPAHEGYVDVAGLIQTLPDDIPAGWLVEYTDEATAQAALDAGEVAGYYVISPDYVQTGNMTYVTEEHNIPTALAVWSLVYFLLGYAMYGAQLAGIGALAPDAKETRTANLLVMSPLTIGYMFNIAIIANPDGPAALALSLFPLTSPISMIARMSITEVPFWQPALAAVLQLLTAALSICSPGSRSRSEVTTAHWSDGHRLSIQGDVEVQSSPEPERDDLDQWISKVLKAGFEDVRPPEQAWQRIAHKLATSVATSMTNKLPDHGARSDT